MLNWFNRLLILVSLLCLSSCKPYQAIESFKYNHKLILTGIVNSIPKENKDELEFIFHTPKYGNILLKASKDYIHYIVPANELQLQVRIYKPYEYKNINSFNYVKYLEHSNIIALGKVIQNSKIAFKGVAITYLFERLRYYLYNYLQNDLQSYKSNTLMLALLIGKKTLTNNNINYF